MIKAGAACAGFLYLCLELCTAVMIFKSLSVCLTALLALASAVPTPANHVVHEKRDVVPERWIKRDRVQGHKLLTMRIGLTQTNLDGVYKHLEDM